MTKQVSEKTGICHLRVTRGVGLLDFLGALDFPELGFSPSRSRAEHWLRSGGVYVNGKRETHLLRFLSGGEVVRLHTRGKRYPAASLGRWLERLVENTHDFVVFDKPSGLPTHPTLDNCLENSKHVLEQELGHPLYTTHRLDIPTTGLLILAKTPEAQVRINKLFAKGLVEKTYHAYSTRAIPPGFYTHFINPESRVPREISTEAHPEWWECRLQVEGYSAISAPPVRLYRHRVRLLTGKTHQIRAQFAALDAPLLGDIVYGCKSETGRFGLECFALAFELGTTFFQFMRPLSLSEEW